MMKLLEILFLALFAQLERLEQWLDRRAKARRKASYMEATGGTECCPHCDTWTWEVGGWEWVEPDPADAKLDIMTCKACGKQSTWLFGPGVYFLIKPVPEKTP